MIWPIIIFFVGLAMLLWCSDTLIEAAISLAKHFRLSNVFIGLTVIAFGTSLPEFLVSFFALVQGSNGISVGNIMGSNIANMALILGWTGLFLPLIFKDAKNLGKIIRKIVILFGIYGVFYLVIQDGYLSRMNGLVFLGLFFGFLAYSYLSGQDEDAVIEDAAMPMGRSVLFTLIGLVGLLVGARLMTGSAIIIARSFGIAEYVIGATIIAVGTSLPELAASFAAVRRGEFGMCLANVIGSNIFNLLMVLGFVSAYMPVSLDLTVLRPDFFIMVFVTGLVAVAMIIWRKIPKLVIYSLIGLYFIYLVRLSMIAR